MSLIRFINAVVSFVVEIAMLALLAIGGYNSFISSPVLRWCAAFTLPLIAILLWAYYISPNKNIGSLNQNYVLPN